jgi:hypothetical protein
MQQNTSVHNISNLPPADEIESLAEQLPVGFAANEDAFYHAMGMDDAQIIIIKEQAELLPDDPQW